MYHYLTGAASWMLLTVLNEMYGVKGEYGALKLKPQLLKEQFENGKASATCMFNGKKHTVTYKMTRRLMQDSIALRKSILTVINMAIVILY